MRYLAHEFSPELQPIGILSRAFEKTALSLASWSKLRKTYWARRSAGRAHREPIASVRLIRETA